MPRPTRFSPEVRARAVRMVLEHEGRARVAVGGVHKHNVPLATIQRTFRRLGLPRLPRTRRRPPRPRQLKLFEQVTHNVSRTCRFFGISRTLFYEWRRRYQRDGLPGLRPRLPGPRVSPFRTPPHLEALVLRVRQERQYGVPRLRLFLRRYHQVSLSPPTIRRILRACSISF